MGVQQRYIFLTNDIGNVGGGQLYLAMKTRHLKSLGWEVRIYHFDSGKPMIDDLKPYADCHVAGLCHRFATLPRRAVQRTLRIMAEGIEGGRTVVESYSTETALWGEALARELSKRGEAAHFCYILTENPAMPMPEEEEFLMYKWRQGLLRGIAPGTLHAILPDVPDGSGDLFAVSVSGETVADVDHPRLHEEEAEGAAADMTLLSVGRLEKPYVRPMLRDIAKFAGYMDRRHERVRLIMVGDSHKPGLMRDLEMEMSEVFGLTVEWWGFVWPLPRGLFRMADVFIGSSGAVEDAAMQGVPAISIDARDCLPIGIYGETTMSEPFRRDDEPPLDLCEMLRELRLQRDLRREARRGMEPEQFEPDYEPHDRIACEAAQSDYYPVEKIPPRGVSGKILRLINRLGGEKLVYLLKRSRKWNI